MHKETHYFRESATLQPGSTNSEPVPWSAQRKGAFLQYMLPSPHSRIWWTGSWSPFVQPRLAKRSDSVFRDCDHRLPPNALLSRSTCNIHECHCSSTCLQTHSYSAEVMGILVRNTPRLTNQRRSGAIIMILNRLFRIFSSPEIPRSAFIQLLCKSYVWGLNTGPLINIELIHTKYFPYPLYYIKHLLYITWFNSPNNHIGPLSISSSVNDGTEAPRD